jgi:hypothetical protein
VSRPLHLVGCLIVKLHAQKEVPTHLAFDPRDLSLLPAATLRSIPRTFSSAITESLGEITWRKRGRLGFRERASTFLSRRGKEQGLGFSGRRAAALPSRFRFTYGVATASVILDNRVACARCTWDAHQSAGVCLVRFFTQSCCLNGTLQYYCCNYFLLSYM